MHGEGEKLRKVSDKIFQEAEPPPDRNRPLEWRRAFNTLHLRLNNVLAVTSFNVNDIDDLQDISESSHDKPTAQSRVSTTVAIRGDVDTDNFDDTILFATKIDKDKGLYVLDRPKGKFTVHIKSGEPTTRQELNFKDVYWGNLGRRECEEGEEGIWIEVTAPKQSIERLTAILKGEPTASVQAWISTRTFSYEVDDALREHWMSRNLFVDGSICIAFLERVQIEAHSKELQRQDDPAAHSDAVDLEAESKEIAQTRAGQIAHAPSIVAAISSLKVAIYIAAVVTAIALLMS
ncbi:MAG: hypothetical protein AB7J97_06090 [Steroidobacteraceae bacterium]